VRTVCLWEREGWLAVLACVVSKGAGDKRAQKPGRSVGININLEFISWALQLITIRELSFELCLSCV
jgi:hypothetical protein